MKAFYCDHFDVELPDGTAGAEHLAALEAMDVAETVEIHLQTVTEARRHAENWDGFPLESRAGPIPTEPIHTDT